jgi:hypothetical protein
LTTKILFLGYGQTELPLVNPNFDIELITRKVADLHSFPALYDYHVLILDVAKINEGFAKADAKLKANAYFDDYPGSEVFGFDGEVSGSVSLFKQQIENGGMVLCFADDESRSFGGSFHITLHKGYYEGYKHESVSSYSWSPVKLNVVSESGLHVYPKTEAGEFKVLTDSFREEDRHWNCHFSGYPPKSRVLFANRAEYAVGIEIPLGRGQLVFLPRFSNMQYAMKLLIENVVVPRLGIKARKESGTVRQPWVTKFEFSAKRRAAEELESAQARITDYSKLEPLLDATGEELRQAVKLAFLKMEFKVTQPPEDKPVQDLDLSFNNWNAVVEIKGKEKDANRDDLRQLLEYLIGQREIEGKTDMNGVFVVNHYCKTDFEKRGTPFTEGAIDLARKYKITLLTSPELYFTIGKVFEGKDSFDAIRDRIIQGKPLS